jgi:hypothetical protein
MNITKGFIEKAGGPRSPIVRAAMVQAGNKIRVEALKMFLLSVGSCEITFDEIDSLGLPVYEKKFSFCGAPMTYALLPPKLFGRYRRLADNVDLEVTRVRNGVIGIMRGESEE